MKRPPFGVRALSLVEIILVIGGLWLLHLIRGGYLS